MRTFTQSLQMSSVHSGLPRTDTNVLSQDLSAKKDEGHEAFDLDSSTPLEIQMPLRPSGYSGQ